MIITAVQKGSTEYVYGEHNRLLFTKNGDLHGHTGSSVSVKRAIRFTPIMTAARLFQYGIIYGITVDIVF